MAADFFVFMKKFLYEKNTLELFEKLLTIPPKRIFSDEFYHVGFDYGESHILATPEDFAANTQNESDEAIAIKFVEDNSEYTADENEKLIFENTTITRIWIMRTLLYFTDHITYKNKEETLSNMTEEEKNDEILGDILSKSKGGHEEIVCHPKSSEAKEVNEEHSNLVDAGIMLEIDKKYYICCSIFNGFSAHAQILSLQELKDDIANYYEFIEVSK